MSESNGGGFVIDDLLNMIVPFDFPFEGHNLKGKWYKYKTTSPTYLNGVMGQVRGLREQVLALTRQIADTKTVDDVLPDLMRERDEVEAQLQRIPYGWMVDSITEWNAIRVFVECAEGHRETVKKESPEPVPCPACNALGPTKKEVLPISVDTFNGWPLLFLGKLNEFFANERTGQNPT